MFTGHQHHLTQATAIKTVTECASQTYSFHHLSPSLTKENRGCMNNSMAKLQNTE